MDKTGDLVEQLAIPLELTGEVTTALDDLGSQLSTIAAARYGDEVPRLGREAAGATGRGRRRRRFLVGFAGLAALLAAGAPAAADFVRLHTGHYGRDGSHYGEFLNVDSPEGIHLLH